MTYYFGSYIPIYFEYNGAVPSYSDGSSITFSLTPGNYYSAVEHYRWESTGVTGNAQSHVLGSTATSCVVH